MSNPGAYRTQAMARSAQCELRVRATAERCPEPAAFTVAKEDGDSVDLCVRCMPGCVHLLTKKGQRVSVRQVQAQR